MGVYEPLGTGVVKIGEGTLFQFILYGSVTGDRAPGITWDWLVNPLDPFRRVEPSFAQFHEPAGRRCNGHGAYVVFRIL